jgi:hypothetical protein
MGLFAFRRLREQEAASNEAAFLSIAEPTPKLETQEPLPAVTDDGNHNRRNSGRRKRQLLPDAGSSRTGN